MYQRYIKVNGTARERGYRVRSAVERTDYYEL